MAVTPEARPVLRLADPASQGVDPGRIDRLYALIEQHVQEGRYPGAQMALARNGNLLAVRSFGRDRVRPLRAASDDTMWLLYSQTKVITASAIWVLVDQGALSFSDKISVRLCPFDRQNMKGRLRLTHT